MRKLRGVAFTSLMLMLLGRCQKTQLSTGKNFLFLFRVAELIVYHRFEDMLHLYKNCDAEECLSNKGRDYSKPGTELELVRFLSICSAHYSHFL